MAGHIFTSEEQDKFTIITDTLKGRITNDQAAKILHISSRQVKRLKKNVRLHGAQAVVHRLKGRQSNNHIEESIKVKAVNLIHEKYTDFKPGFAKEKLEEHHHILVSPETVRGWMIKENLWKPHKQRKAGAYYAWRPRREYFGELQQFDGSYHYWFEKRYCDDEGSPIEVCLLASIDDATGTITQATFSANEGVMSVFTFWLKYIERLGKPISIYLDKFSTYKINHKAALDNSELMTQFQRAMQQLGIELITAHSPQAKGRIERLFGTLQDRLVKEMRLERVNNPTDGNKFLKDVFLPQYNNKFPIKASKEGNVHRPLSEDDKKYISRIFSIQSTRRINNDFTIQFKNNWYQLQEIQPITVRARETVLTEVWLDGTIHFNLREFYLVYTVLPERPKKITKQPTILTTHKLNWNPPSTHPWKKPFKNWK